MSRGWLETSVGWARVDYFSDVIESFGFVEKKPLSLIEELFPQPLVRVVEAYRNSANVIPFLAMEGTPYQRTVWQILADIPCGSTTTYGEIAERVGGASHARTVAGACSRNQTAIMIPCHRVIGQGTIGGYRWGVDKKLLLLEWEGRRGNVDGLFRSFWRNAEEK